jgi:hypothetical protein
VEQALFEMLRDDEQLIVRAIHAVRMPNFVNSVAWIAPIRTRPRRTYDGYSTEYDPSGEHTPYLVRDYISRKKPPTRFLTSVHEYGVDSGLYDSIYVKRYGTGAAAPFELGVTFSDKKYRIDNVGYGVSQSLPVAVELIARPPGTWFAIQQPEVHLHPRAQAALGSLIWTMAEQYDKRFYIETHSDFTIDRFRIHRRKSYEAAGNALTAQVLFFERDITGNKVTSIPILDSGEYSDEQPDSFRRFFIDEQLAILGL